MTDQIWINLKSISEKYINELWWRIVLRHLSAPSASWALAYPLIRLVYTFKPISFLLLLLLLLPLLLLCGENPFALFWFCNKRENCSSIKTVSPRRAWCWISRCALRSCCVIFSYNYFHLISSSQPQLPHNEFKFVNYFGRNLIQIRINRPHNNLIFCQLEHSIVHVM